MMARIGDIEARFTLERKDSARIPLLAWAVANFAVLMVLPLRLDAEAARNPPLESGFSSYAGEVRAKIEPFWIAPAETSPGMVCTVVITQKVTGELDDPQVRDCASPALAKSVAFAVYLASPLPPPPSSDFANRGMVMTFVVPQMVNTSHAHGIGPDSTLPELLGQQTGKAGESIATVHVCVDDKGYLTEPPTIATSSGNPQFDAGALRLAKAASGRYKVTDGVRCFGFRIAFTSRN